MPFSRISVRRAFAITDTYRSLPQVNVELSLRKRCKEKSLQLLSRMLQSGHFVAKSLSDKELKEYSSTFPWGLRHWSAQHLGLST